ncbi:2Fe-2S iron-sulfur cluster-binding protein [Polycyclovorans algicola]|uniref:2Fe-2S iron-sulfur cluster-binding protein n=1 Tax=Polycyclovorans algicola TaxID=616992 RepID=UPI0004A74C74|nr:2Fe-2S iron-sulfur cluster-binding protein [Polycyclovorans algicola]
MADVLVTLRDGRQCSLDAADGELLMEVLRNGEAGVDGTCGGACSCGTCHVYIADEWAARLPAKSEDEAMMLEALADFVELKPTSRLACQIPLTAEFKGIAVTIAPQVE